MILNIHSNASHLSKPKACSRVGGHFFLSNGTNKAPNNGGILNTSQIIKSIMSSAAEAKLGALYINASKAAPCRTLLEELGHKQPSTPIQTNNSTALGVVTHNILPRRLKAMDMCVWWLRGHKSQDQFRYYWHPGPTNRGDYFTKHHCSAHHTKKRPEFLTQPLSPTHYAPPPRGNRPPLAKVSCIHNLASRQQQQPKIINIQVRESGRVCLISQGTYLGIGNSHVDPASLAQDTLYIRTHVR